jgi:hypothetical protein
VVLKRIGVDRFDLLCRAGDRRSHVTLLIADECFLGVEARLEHLGDRGARYLGIRPLVPDGGQRLERGLGLPPSLGDDRDTRVADLHHLFTPGIFMALAASKLLTLPPKTGLSLTAAQSIPGSLTSME